METYPPVRKTLIKKPNNYEAYEGCTLHGHPPRHIPPSLKGLSLCQHPVRQVRLSCATAQDARESNPTKLCLISLLTSFFQTWKPNIRPVIMYTFFPP